MGLVLVKMVMFLVDGVVAAYQYKQYNAMPPVHRSIGFDWIFSFWALLPLGDFI